jgi:hypothetical protein
MARAVSLCGVWLLLLCSFCLAQEQMPVAVVVNPANPATDISLPTLRDFFQCEKLYWRTGQRVMAFTRQPGSPEHWIMLRAIYKMDQAEYQNLSVMKQMRGETSCRVTELPSKGILQEGLRSFAGAIALVRVADVTREMKVLTVDGKHIQDAAYPLQ